jgi:hypothetical protein
VSIIISNVRINDLARELGVRSRHLLDFLRKRSIYGYTHTSWVNSSLAGEIRAEFSDPSGQSERETRIEQLVIRPHDGAVPGPEPTPVFSQVPHQRAKKKKRAAKKRQCLDCYAYVPKTEFEAHILEHVRDAQRAVKRAKPITKTQPSQKRISPEFRINGIFPPRPKPAPPLALERICLECRRLVHPATMEQHMRDHREHSKLPWPAR